MKFIFVLRILLTFPIYYILACDPIHDQEIYSDIEAPLIIHSNNTTIKDSNDSKIQDRNHYDYCCNFSRIIKILFCIENNKSFFELNRCYESIFLILPSELILDIGDLLDPLTIVNLSQTCKAAQMLFSTSYWEHKCLEENLLPWRGDVSPQNVYFANFWYKTQKIEKIKKAALIGHPESKLLLRNMQINTANNLQHTKIFVKPDSSYNYFGRKFSGGRYYY